MRKPRGFTIVELVVVMTIMAILLTLGVVGLNASQLNARNMKRDTDIDAIAKGLEVRYVRGNAYAVAPAYINKGSYPSVQEFRHAQGIAITGISPTQTSMYLDQILTGTKIDNFIPPGAGDGADIKTTFKPVCTTACTAGVAATINTAINGSNNVYVYEPVSADGNVCVNTECIRYNLYYLPEGASVYKTKESLRQ